MPGRAGRLAGVTSLAVTSARSSAVGCGAGSVSRAGVAGGMRARKRRADAAGQRVASLDIHPDVGRVRGRGGFGGGGGGPAGGGDLVQPSLNVIQAQAGPEPDPDPFADPARLGPQDQRQAAGAVGDDEFREAGPDAVPGDQAPGQRVEPAADRLDGGRDADDGDERPAGK